ncbi:MULTISPECIES: hypothetical protein [unclassified Pedobacter]|uniref:hypothetical protein n=1 Tax=unclassified Pedobacter TaxID=2628915 RepID=UPI0014241D3C|nr:MULTISPECIES: hypothetical protein [unclassified Pedobacter]NII85961.1 hypothetical protein [Pedobacter sp. SG908]NMN39125.1 hypothetical protein [Pedobacter sp. SG918]
MIDPEDDNYSNDPNDALRREDDVENINEINGDDTSIEHDKDLLQQADEASRASYELNLDDEDDDLDD